MESMSPYLKKEQRFRESDRVFKKGGGAYEKGRYRGRVLIRRDFCTAPFLSAAGESCYLENRRNGYSCT